MNHRRASLARVCVNCHRSSADNWSKWWSSTFLSLDFSRPESGHSFIRWAVDCRRCVPDSFLGVRNASVSFKSPMTSASVMVMQIVCALGHLCGPNLKCLTISMKGRRVPPNVYFVGEYLSSLVALEVLEIYMNGGWLALSIPAHVPLRLVLVHNGCLRTDRTLFLPPSLKYLLIPEPSRVSDHSSWVDHVSARLPSLRLLNLRGCGVPLDLGGLTGVTGLECLSLDGAHHDVSETLATLPRLSALTGLRLDCNPTLTSVDFLHKLPSLEELNLSATCVTDLHPVSALRHLRHLSMDDWMVVGGVQWLTGLRSLGSLSVRIWSHVLVSDCRELSRLTQLTSLEVLKRECMPAEFANLFFPHIPNCLYAIV